MFSLYFRNLIFTILQPGIVCGLIPWLLVREELKTLPSFPFPFYQWIGLLMVAIGLFIVLYCVNSFAKEGRGTLSPADPTKKLVVKGLYHYSRNPMYIGVLFILAGETIFLRSFQLGIYMFVVFVGFFIFVVVFEEPRLTRDFGIDYVDYKKRVRRWI